MRARRLQIIRSKSNSASVDKQIYGECKSILLAFQRTLMSGIGNKNLQEHPSPEFLRLLADNRVYFNCHSYQLYSFLDTSMADVLENIKSIVLGEILLLWTRFRHASYYDTTTTLPETNRTAWGSTSENLAGNPEIYISNKDDHDKYYNYYEYEQPHIMKLIVNRLPNLKEVALWATSNIADGRHYYPVIVNNFLRMIAAGKIDKLQLLYLPVHYNDPSRLSNIVDCSPFFRGGVTTGEIDGSEESEEASSNTSGSKIETIHLLESRTHQWGLDIVDKGETIWGISNIKYVRTVRRQDASEYQKSEAHSAVFTEESARLSARARHEREQLLDKQFSDLNKLRWSLDF
jgi:hypothetical protein